MNYVSFCRQTVRVALTGLLLTGMSLPALAVNLHNGLISYWPLNEGTGTTAGDVGPQGFVTDNGELRNGPAWIEGKFGAGLQFNGVDQDVLIPASSDMDMSSNAVTVSAWVKLDQLPSELAGSFSGIYDSDPDNYVLYLDKGNNELRFKATIMGGAAERPGVLARQLDTTSWHHVMGVYDGAKGSMAIYFDGKVADRVSNINLLNGVVRAEQIASIGGQPVLEAPHAPVNLFQGGISDVAVWNRALGAAEAQYLYNNGVGNAVGAVNADITPGLTPVQPVAQPVIYYNFDGNLDNQGTGGSALNATLHDVPGRNDNLYSPSQFGQGVDLRENPIETFSDDEPGDFLSVGYTLPESGTIAMRAQVGQLFNYNSLWSNSSHENDWEAWVYGDGRIAARADRGTARMEHNIFLFDDQGIGEHHYAFTWERNGDLVESRLFIDGQQQGLVVGNWRDPGDTFFIGGGTGLPGTNHLANALFDEVRIYDSALSEAEILFLSQNAPETMIFSGDYNGDGVVNASDYVVWRNTLGNNVTPFSGADGSGNGIVGVEDYNIWKTDYTNSGLQAGLANAPVPEPSTLAMIFASLGAAAWCRWRRSPA